MNNDLVDIAYKLAESKDPIEICNALKQAECAGFDAGYAHALSKVLGMLTKERSLLSTGDHR